MVNFIQDGIFDDGLAPEIAVGQLARAVRISKGIVRLTFCRVSEVHDGLISHRVCLHTLWDYEQWVATQMALSKAVTDAGGTMPIRQSGHRINLVSH